MGLREERVAKNEAAARKINEQIEQAVESISPGSFMHIICECGYDTCDLFTAVLKVSRRRSETTLASSSSATSM